VMVLDVMALERQFEVSLSRRRIGERILPVCLLRSLVALAYFTCKSLTASSTFFARSSIPLEVMPSSLLNSKRGTARWVLKTFSSTPSSPPMYPSIVLSSVVSLSGYVASDILWTQSLTVRVELPSPELTPKVCLSIASLGCGLSTDPE